MPTRINTVSEIEADEDDIEQLLNDCYGDVTVCGFTHGQGTLLREIDPVAFRCAVSDEPLRYQCDTCKAVHEYEEDALSCCEVWECDVCGEEHCTEADADICCDADEEVHDD